MEHDCNFIGFVAYLDSFCSGLTSPICKVVTAKINDCIDKKHVHVTLPGLCINNHKVPKHTSSCHARNKHTQAQYRALTLVNQIGLCGSNVLGHSTDGLV